MKDNNKTTTNNTTNNMPASIPAWKRLVRPLNVQVNPEFADAATEVAIATKEAVTLGAEKTGLFAKLMGRKAGAAMAALKETK